MEWLGEIIAQVGDDRAKGLLERDVGEVVEGIKNN